MINLEELGLRYSMNQKGKRRTSMLEFDGIIDRDNMNIINSLLNLKEGAGEDQINKLKQMLVGGSHARKHKTIDVTPEDI